MRTLSSPDSDSNIMTWRYDERIGSDPNNCSKVIEVLLDKLHEGNWPNKDTFGIHMAMEEAIMNAMCHGNGRANDKFVHIEIEIGEQSFFARVTDEGKGFCLDDIPDPTAVENIGKTSGRGVRLIQHFMDSAVYNQRGNSIVLQKARSTE